MSVGGRKDWKDLRSLGKKEEKKRKKKIVTKWLRWYEIVCCAERESGRAR
jgi:hypothetical protein